MKIQNFKNHRNQNLDALRGVAVILILIAHLPDQNRHLLRPEENIIYMTLRSMGWLGVDIFFPLSGFLISSSLFHELDKNGNINLINFYIKRVLRIIPPLYFLVLSVYFFKDYLSVMPEIRLSQYLGDLLFIQNYWDSIFRITWSLAVEEHFYILFPFILILLKSRGLLNGKPIFFMVIFFYFMRLIQFYYGSTYTDLYIWSHCRFDSLFLGVLGAWAIRYRNDIIKKYCTKYCVFSNIAFVILIVFLFKRESIFMITFGYSYIPFASTIIILYLTNRGSSLNGTSFFSWVGRFSYSTYLWHLPVQYFTLYYLSFSMKFNENEYAFVYIVLSLLFSWAMAQIIETNSRKLRNFIIPLHNW